ncbi:MAG: RNA polymerase sigma factor [Candidatus Omnitrophica bacterium]|nr:RNA polymerase sigma factor [Candidatus Omnitrophota bacterium]
MSDISNELVMKASGGDMAAFEEIYRATSGFVYNIALRITNNRDDADEVVQDVFLKVYRSLNGFGFRSSFKTWIYRIAANTAINYCKASERRSRGNVVYDPVAHDRLSADKSKEVLDKEEAGETVRRLLAALDPDQRACVVLREIEGMDYASIADVLRININTVRSRLKRAREKLLAIGKKG